MTEPDSKPPQKGWTRQSKINAYIIGSLLGGGLLGFSTALNTSSAPNGLLVGLVCIAMLAVLAANVHYIRLLDELARQTHEVAFLWAGVATMAFGMIPIFALLGFPDFELPALESWLGTKTHAFAAGVGATIGVLVVTYFAVWTHLWLKRR